MRRLIFSLRMWSRLPAADNGPGNLAPGRVFTLSLRWGYGIKTVPVLLHGMGLIQQLQLPRVPLTFPWQTADSLLAVMSYTVIETGSLNPRLKSE